MDWATWWAVAWVGRRACCSFLPVGTWHTQQQVGMGGGGWKLSGEWGSRLQTHRTTGHFHGVSGLLSPADTRRRGPTLTQQMRRPFQSSDACSVG